MSLSIDAEYFDGRSSRRHSVTVAVIDGKVNVSGEGIAFEADAGAVKISPRMAGMPRRLEFPDGGLAITHDNDAVDAAFLVAAERTLVHRLESHVGFVVAALVLTIAVCWAGYRYGVPWAARQVASHIPLAVEAELGKETLEMLDEIAFEPTGLAAPRRAQLTDMFAQLRTAAGQPESVRLAFRDGGWIGANAFALPGGTVVMTDQLAAHMQNDDQLAGVLAHELGHIDHRHSMRYVLQDSITGLLAMAVYGDASAVAGIAVTIPSALLHAQYSQGFEREADSYAFELLKKTGRSPRDLGRALAALDAATEDADKSSGRSCENPEGGGKSEPHKPSRDFGYLSTHPPTEERIRAAEEAAQ